MKRVFSCLCGVLWCASSSAVMAEVGAGPNDGRYLNAPEDIRPYLGANKVAHEPERAGPELLGLKLGGYIQPGFIYQVDTPMNDDDHPGFEFANARLTAAGVRELNDAWQAQMDFGFDIASGNFDAKDVYGGIGLKNGLFQLDIGQMKLPFGLALMQSEAQLQFPVSAKIRELAFGRDQGVRVRGELLLKPIWLGWSAMIANGEGGFRSRRNIDDEFVYGGRVEVGLNKPSASEADLKNSPLQITAGGSVAHTPALGKGFGLDDVGLAETRYGGDLRFQFRGVSARAEFVGAERAGRAVNGEPGSEVSRRGMVFQAGYVLPFDLGGPQFEPVFRVEIIDLNRGTDGFENSAEPLIDNTETRTLQFGANAYLDGHRAKLQLVYQLTDLLEGPKTDSSGAPLIGDSFMAFVQLGWF